MEIIQKDNPTVNGYFRAIENGDILGTITYNWLKDNTLAIDHTEVDPDREDEGIGKKLVESVFNFAKQKNVKIKPVCKFAKSVLENMDEAKEMIVN